MTNQTANYICQRQSVQNLPLGVTLSLYPGSHLPSHSSSGRGSLIRGAQLIILEYTYMYVCLSLPFLLCMKLDSNSTHVHPTCPAINCTENAFPFHVEESMTRPSLGDLLCPTPPAGPSLGCWLVALLGSVLLRIDGAMLEQPDPPPSFDRKQYKSWAGGVGSKCRA